MVYRFRITMDDYSDLERVIEIKDDQTFEMLHKAIIESVDFDDSQMASFYLCDDHWNEKLEITLIDMSDVEEENFTPIMSKVKLNQYFNKIEDKFKYVYDFVLMWNFKGELEDINEESGKKINYPIITQKIGEAPQQYAEEKFPEALSEEEDVLVNDLIIKNHEVFSHDEDDEFEDEFEDEESWDAGFDEFEKGHGHDDEW